MKQMIENAILKMARQQKSLIRALLRGHQRHIQYIYLAGGYFKDLNQTECDLDLFTEDMWNVVEGAHKTPNAQSFEYMGRKIQLCNYRKGSLKDLVDSFDFSHCQCGVTFTFNELGEIDVSEAYYTEAWCRWWIEGIISFTGSDYPVSSLVRAGKLYKKGLINSWQHTNLVLDCLHAVACRGFKNEADVRNQLDSIDLQYIDESAEGRRHYRLITSLPWKEPETQP